MIINGKEYPLWGNIVKNKNEIIGKKLIEEDMGIRAETIITDVILEANGDKSAYFTIEGEDFSCGFDVHHGGVRGGDDELIFGGFYGSEFWVE